MAALPKVCVCVCTFRRPELLRRTLDGLAALDHAGQFTIAIVVVDNDRAESAREVVSVFQTSSPLEILYAVEPEQNIALARNRAVQNAAGDFIAFIDDDEFPEPQWLAKMLKACEEFRADGVLGPVRPHFDQPPPRWLIQGRFCERPEHETGRVLDWRETRTGNALVSRGILEGLAGPFDPALGSGGEDQDFFRRLMAKGHRFIWCNEGVVYEVVPPERWNRSYFFRRALLRGQNERHMLNARSIIKSLMAVPLYALSLPFLLLAGQHFFVRYSIRLLDHAGKLLAAAGVRLVGEKYLSG